jgi:hypothetical protein
MTLNVYGALGLPAASLAVQLTVVVPTGKVLPEAGVHVTVGCASTVSVAVGVKVTTAPEALEAYALMSVGTVKVGAAESLTVTLNVFGVLVLPVASLAVQLTVVSPSGNVLPEAGAQVIVGFASTASLADGAGEKVTTAPAPLVASTVMPLGTVRLGAVVSLTVTLNDFSALVLPAASLAVQLTVVSPSAKVPPEAGIHDPVGCSSTVSVAVGEKVTAAPAELVASTIMSDG